MVKCKILKVNFDPNSKWLELWLEGLPFEKAFVYDEVSGKNVISDQDQWNFCCKTYMFVQWFEKGFYSYPNWDNLVGIECEYYKDEQQHDHECLKFELKKEDFENYIKQFVK